MFLVSLSAFIDFVLKNSILLLIGTGIAVAWANVDLSSYEHVAEPLHFLVNDVGMVFFFAVAAKEVFEATLPGGSLASFRAAASPLAAAVGGMIAPALLFTAFVATLGPAELLRGWAIPCATDIAFSLMIARMVFPARHPGIAFLLLLAIADDALGLVILAIFYPTGAVSAPTLAALMSAAVLLAFALRRRQVAAVWPYLAGPGVLSWAALYWGGFHPALALVPIVPFMPHSAQDLGFFEPAERLQLDTLNRFERAVLVPVQLVLFVFGFANAGVPFERIGPGTYYVLAALLIGKPLGILLSTYLARVAGARLPHGLGIGDLVIVGITASIGFTVSLFFATAAFPAGPALAETKMGALFSFVAAPLALTAAAATRRWRAEHDAR